MSNVAKKGLVITTAFAALLLAGCASQGSACGNTTAQPVAAPAPVAPVNACKGQSACKSKKVVKHHKAKTTTSSTTSTTTNTSSADQSGQ